MRERDEQISISMASRRDARTEDRAKLMGRRMFGPPGGMDECCAAAHRCNCADRRLKYGHRETKMAACSDDMIAAFFGTDPLRGADALEHFRRLEALKAIEYIVPMESEGRTRWPQVEGRLIDLAGSLGPGVIAHLASVIGRGNRHNKGLASPCFRAFQATDEHSRPLREILETCVSDRHSVRTAIEALGYLGASDWALSLVEFAKGAPWGQKSGASLGVDRVSGDDLELYYYHVATALARFAARSTDASRVRYVLGLLSDFTSLCDETIFYMSPSAYSAAGDVSGEFSDRTIDPVVKTWGRHSNVRLQKLSMDILAAIAPTRAAKFLIEIATAHEIDGSVRVAASIALGELRHPQAAARLADALRERTNREDELSWAYSVLYPLAADWPRLDDYRQAITAKDDEVAAQLLFSLSVAGDTRHSRELVDRLDHSEPFQRWTAALSLARLLGEEARQHLDGRAEEAVDDLERCGMYAAAVHAGDHTKIPHLHAALQQYKSLPQVRVIWKAEFIDAFRHTNAFDPRAFDLWSRAASISERQFRNLDTHIYPSIRRADARTGGKRPLPPEPIELGVALNKVFVSYSRNDRQWLERFQRMMTPLIRAGRVELWDDTRMRPGKWRDQIDEALKTAKVALFLVSEHFLASDFIMRHELPELLRLAEERQATIRWVLLDYCLWDQSELSDYDCEHDPKIPLVAMAEAEQTRLIALTCSKIGESLRPPSGQRSQAR
jgi:HEAT repeat protein